MERKLIRSTIAILNKNMKKANSGKRQEMDPESKRLYKRAWNRGRVYGEQIWKSKLSARIKEVQSRKDLQKNGKEGEKVVEANAML